MPGTYSAILKGDRLEWVGAAPGPEFQNQTVAVEVTIAADSEVGLVDPHERRQRLIGALERIADRGTLATIDDPVAWQRELRQDRPLPGRE